MTGGSRPDGRPTGWPAGPEGLGSDSGPGGGRQGRPDRRIVLGSEGEQIAADWYEANGYEVLERNWRRREGEIDLIVRRGKTVAFCEVKTRSSDRYGSGVESVVASKQRRIRRLAGRWLSERAPQAGRGRLDVRFDVVDITAGRIDVVEHAF